MSHHCCSSHASRREENAALLLSLTGSRLNRSSERTRLSLSLFASLSVTHRFLSVVWSMRSSFSSHPLSASLLLSASLTFSFLECPPHSASCYLLFACLAAFWLLYLTLTDKFSRIPPTPCGHADNYGFCSLRLNDRYL